MGATLYTIERHILDQQRRYPNATGDFSRLLYDIALAAKLIARETTRAGLVDILGATESENLYGERQQKLDLFADDVIFKMNDHTHRLCAMASEEHDDIIPIPTHFGTGRYALLYDPLDGSSNIDVNVAVGTIFAIHRKISRGETGTLEDCLQPGSKLAAAGYVVYGSSTMLVYSTGQGVHGFTLEPSVGEFLLSHDHIRIPDTPRYFSTNQGNERVWTEGVRRYTRWLQGMDAGLDTGTEAGSDAGSDANQQPSLSARYIGSMVADFHRNLLRGGVFYYPADVQDAAKPYGKMRLMFEAQALAFLAQQAGGYASDGVGSILDIQPHSLHQRVPLFIGNTALVEQAEAFIRRYDQAWIDAYLPYRSGQVG